MARRVSWPEEARFPAFSVSSLLLLAALLCVPGVMRSIEEARYSEAASLLAGREVSVHCQTFSESAFRYMGHAAGEVQWGPDGPSYETLLSGETCAALERFVSDPAAAGFDEWYAVQTLSHEAMHLSGIFDEAETECAAYQRSALVAVELGASRDLALMEVSALWAKAYPGMPAQYRDAACAPGGLLDEGLGHGPW